MEASIAGWREGRRIAARCSWADRAAHRAHHRTEKATSIRGAACSTRVKLDAVRVSSAPGAGAGTA
eukprot:scaffold4408_cov143-Isochrysis_galbana.AAC.7